MDRDRRINRAGNSRARKTLVQLAWLWLRYQPESSQAAWFRDRVGSLQGRIRRITIVALARKLLIAIWPSDHEAVHFGHLTLRRWFPACRLRSFGVDGVRQCGSSGRHVSLTS